MLPTQYRRAIRGAAAWLRAHTHTSTDTHLPDADREALRDLVAAAARFERARRGAPTYPEDAAVLDAMLAPSEEGGEVCEVKRRGGPTSPSAEKEYW